jgi:hypothetical protein
LKLICESFLRIQTARTQTHTHARAHTHTHTHTLTHTRIQTHEGQERQDGVDRKGKAEDLHATSWLRRAALQVSCVLLYPEP